MDRSCWVQAKIKITGIEKFKELSAQVNWRITWIYTKMKEFRQKAGTQEPDHRKMNEWPKNEYIAAEMKSSE